MQYKLKMLQFNPNAPSTFLWSMSDAHSRMIRRLEQTSSQTSELSEAVLIQSCNRKFKNIKSVEDMALDLQSVESKSAKAIVC